jgi:predicted RNA-binding Zn ribbon-like protein
MNNSKVTSQSFMAVGEHPALDFLNTVFMRDGERRDLFGSDDDVKCWLTFFEMESTKGEPFERGQQVELFQDARRLRESVRKLVWARKSGAVASARVLNEFLKQGQSFFELQWYPESTAHQKPLRTYKRVANSQKALLRPVADAMADLLVTPRFELVKKCENPVCSLLFYDHTKSHRRRWCSTALCGNRMKVAAFRERLKLKT